MEKTRCEGGVGVGARATGGNQLRTDSNAKTVCPQLVRSEAITLEGLRQPRVRAGDDRQVLEAQAELRAAFVDGWSIRSIEPAMFAVTIDDNGAEAWLATIERL